jgi:hypothetical protein
VRQHKEKDRPAFRQTVSESFAFPLRRGFSGRE